MLSYFLSPKGRINSIIICSTVIISNKVCAIHVILKINKSVPDSRHFEGKSRFGKSGGREGGGVIIKENI